MAPTPNHENPFKRVPDTNRGYDPRYAPMPGTPLYNSTYNGRQYALQYGHYVSPDASGAEGPEPGYIPGHLVKVGYRPNGNGNGGYAYDYGSEYGASSTTTMTSNGANPTDEPAVVIRGEEIGIVIMVLLLWLGAIVLFFHRWGKIRMLEPYQPKFMETHRLSCPMADVTGLPHGPRTYSNFNLSNQIGASPHFAKCNYHGVGVLGGSGGIGAIGSGPSAIAQQILSTAAATSRPRQNSVFVTSPLSTVAVYGSGNLKNASRKTKSALDLSTLVLAEHLENVRRNSKNSITQL